MWCAAPTGFVAAGALAAIEARLEDSSAGEVIRVLDYGAGTGTATIELLKACRERGIEEELERRGVSLELHLVDLPTSWFAQGFALLRDCAWTRFHSLRAERGGFRSLTEVTGGATMDAVMVNMVFHLIPPRAFGRAVSELAAVTAPGGRLLWSAPDLGPAGRHSVPMHDITRALRARWLELLRGEGSSGAEDAGEIDTQALSPEVRKVARNLRETLDAEALRAARERAERHILAHPLPATDVVAALEDSGFTGEIELRGYEMLDEDILNGALVPSNQEEFLPEIAEREVRERVIRELMVEEIIPAMHREPAGTAHGVNLHWTLGAFTRRQ